MIVNCPNCSKKFNIDSKLIPIQGRLLQCSNCNHKWNFVPEKKNQTELQTEIKPIAKEAEKTNLNEILINKNEDVKKPTIKKNKKINEKQKISEAINIRLKELEKLEIDDSNIVKAKVLLDKRNEGFAKDFCRKIKNKKNFYHHIGIYIYTPHSLRKFVELKQSPKEIERSLEQMRAMDPLTPVLESD